MSIKLSNKPGFARVALIVSLAVIALITTTGWLVYKRRTSSINSFADCVKSGRPIQESYPEVCATPDGRRFTNPAQTN